MQEKGYVEFRSTSLESKNFESGCSLVSGIRKLVSGVS